MRARTEAIAAFAAVLQELRRSVGTPPFREMSGRSGAISHTTLHEATKGNRLPSWETTVEFVKACGADPAEYRERWENANHTVRAARESQALEQLAPEVSASALVPQSSGESTGIHQPTVPVPMPTPVPVPRSASASGGRGRRRLTRPAAVGWATVVIGAGVVVVAVSGGFGAAGDYRNNSGSASTAGPAPANCPVLASNPASAPPTHSGDAAAFIADVTLPDCTSVGAGRTVTKVWRLKNTGTVRWKGYSLRRLDLPQQAGQCQTIAEVPVDETDPGEMVDIRTDVTTPTKPGLCYVRFKMVDASGRIAFPGSRPVNFQLIVQTGR